MPRASSDTFSETGAIKLAESIERYWWDKGHAEVVAWVELMTAPIRIGLEIAASPGVKRIASTQAKMWAVRSNLVNGLPPREAWKKAA